MKQNLKIFIILLLCLSMSIVKVNAKSYKESLFQLKENVTIDKELNVTSFIAGEKVILNKRIDGIGFIAGNDLVINEKQEYIFGIGTNIKIKNEIEKDLFLLGTNININSNIKRDAYIAGENIEIKGNIDRNIYIYGTEVVLNGNFKGNVTINAVKINIDKNTTINGTLKYNETSTIEGVNPTNLNTKTYDTNNVISLKDYILSFVSTFIHIAILGIVIVFIKESLLKNSLNQTQNATTKTMLTLIGKGFLILIGVPIVSIMLIFSDIFISVGVLMFILYCILMYISEIFVSYYIANLIDKKYLKKNMNSYLLTIFGLLIIKILSIIPVVGALISLLSILLGLGILGNMIIEIKTNE